jgi:hypothetical protein
MTMSQTPASLPLFWVPPELAPELRDPFDPYMPVSEESAAPKGHFDRRAIHRPARRMEGADGKQSVNDPEEYGISQAELDAILADLAEFKIDVNPSNILHAIEANTLRRVLLEMGIDPHKRVSSTRDRLGMVRLTFVDLRRMLDQGFFARQDQAA